MSFAEIVSANVVGYQKMDFDKSGWMINVGVQFSNVGEVASFTLDDTFFGGASAENDQVVTMDADAWDVNTYDKLGAGDGWMLTPAGGGEQEFMASIVANKGDMLYYIPSEASDLTVAGQVATLGEQSITFDIDNEEGQWMFPLVNPFPVDTKWGELDAFTKENDQLIMLDADAWDVNTYDRLGDGDGWMLTPAGGGEQEFINAPDEVIIPAGGAAYYIPTETVTWTVTL